MPRRDRSQMRAGHDGPNAGTAIGWYDASIVEAWRTAARRLRHSMRQPGAPPGLVRVSFMASSFGRGAAHRAAGEPDGQPRGVIEATAYDLLPIRAGISWREAC